jgi:aarF domain-containing kinase
MSGKRLVDLAALLNASRGVAQKHIALRSRQIDVYNRTSTLARAVRSQTERVTETAKAASFLASRLNESAPDWAGEAQDTKSDAKWSEDPIPSRKSTAAGSTINGANNGLTQDHFYEQSVGNSAVDEPPRGDLNITQERASRYPLPDGTIPTTESDINTRETDHDVVSTRVLDELPKAHLGSEGLQPAASNKSTIPTPANKLLSAAAARTIQRQSELQIPSQSADALGEYSADPLEEGHDEDSFYRKSGHTSPTLSSLPRVKIPKYPSNIQDGTSYLQEGYINSDSYYSAGKLKNLEQIPAVEAEPEQEQVPEGVNTDLFYSPRVARLLGGNIQGGKKPQLELKGVREAPIEKSPLAEGKDQDTFNIRRSSQNIAAATKVTSVPKPSASSPLVSKDDDIEKLAQDIAEETTKGPVKVSCFP